MTHHTSDSVGDAEQILAVGSLELVAQLDSGGNAVFEAVAELDGVQMRCVYKPRRGERPLWDFPDGNLAGREVASYLVARSVGLDVIPPTILRDGPLGVGACQLWVDNDVQAAEKLIDLHPATAVPAGWRPVMRGEGPDGEDVVLAHADDRRLRSLALLDAVLNNADRKAGHIFVTDTGTVFGIDHGLTFNVEPKLRTVLWGWVDEPFHQEDQALTQALTDSIAQHTTALAQHLTSAELLACQKRATTLLETARFPRPSGTWPAFPWPLW